ncbi:MAG: protein kinase domain-containing protein, partial [bacterium]
DRGTFLKYFDRVCEAVAYAHSRGVIHRDLKPANVMIGSFGEVQVMDWGLAKVLARGGLADDRRKSMSRTEVSVIETVRSGSSTGGSLAGSVFGTPAYMPPEQARGEVEDLDERADVFGLGAILCEVLTGDPPYVAETTEEVHRLAKRGYLDDAMARLGRSGADREVIDLAKRCLAFEPRDRPQDARAVSRDVRAYLDSLEERARKLEFRAAKTRFRATAAVLLVLALGAASASYLWVDRERREALAQSAVRIEKAVSEARVRMAEAEASGGSAPKWAVALEAVEAAGRLVTPGAVPASEEELASLRRRIESEMDSHELVAALEKIRDDALYGNTSYAHHDAAYGQAFAGFLGADLFSLSPAGVAEKVRQTTRSAEIAQALDDWALLRRELRRPHETLRDISRAVDSNPGRARVWQLVESAGAESVERLVDGPEGKDVSASVLGVLADSLSHSGHASAAERLLRRAVEIEPGSFRANFQLGRLLADPRVGRVREGLPHLFAARTLRPRDRCTNFRLAEAYAGAGLWDQALGQCAIATDLGFADDWGTKDTLAILEKDGAVFSPAVLDRFLQTMERVRARDPDVPPRIWEVIGAARGLRAANSNGSEILARAEGDVARTGRADPFVLDMLARVQMATGDRRGAVRTLEEAMAFASAPPGWSRRL